MRIPLIALTAAALVLAAPVKAQDAPLEFGQFTISPQFNPDGVSLEGEGEDRALILERADIMLDDADFSEGVIEFQIAFENEYGFGGIYWHSSDDGADSEYFYLRQHKSGLPDAGQYTPVRGGLTSWQIYTDGNGIAPFAYTYEGWNRVRLVVAGDRADIYFNGSERPLLHIPDLASDRGHGRIGFRSTGPFGKIKISRLSIRPLAPGEGIVGTAKQGIVPPANPIPRWDVSQPFAQSRIAGELTIPADLAAMPAHIAIDSDRSGIADLSRAVAIGQDADTVVVSTRITSQGPQLVRMPFGYSDRVHLYLNGELVFAGSAGWRSRDYFFLGTIGYHDSVTLRLREGDNLLQAVVSETFGGWGFAAAIPGAEGITYSTRH